MKSSMTCPICDCSLPAEIDANASLFPFCSKTCKQADLYRWMTGKYALIEDLTPEQLGEISAEIDSSDSY